MKLMMILPALLLSACQFSAGMQRRDAEYKGRPLLRGALIRDAQGNLTEEAIQRLLTSRIDLPAKAKMAVVPYSHVALQVRDDWRLTEALPVEFLQCRRSFLNAVEEPLLKTGRFTEITHIPDLLLPSD